MSDARYNLKHKISACERTHLYRTLILKENNLRMKTQIETLTVGFETVTQMIEKAIKGQKCLHDRYKIKAKYLFQDSNHVKILKLCLSIAFLQYGWIFNGGFSWLKRSKFEKWSNLVNSYLFQLSFMRNIFLEFFVMSILLCFSIITHAQFFLRALTLIAMFFNFHSRAINL